MLRRPRPQEKRLDLHRHLAELVRSEERMLPSSTAVVDPTYFGLKLYELLTLFGIMIGPLIAVAVTLWIEGRRGTRERRANIARTLLATRHLAADPQYNGAINLIPLEFNSAKSVMSAWREYIEQVMHQPDEANRIRHNEIVAAKQSTLIYRILRELKYDLSESDIRTSAYASMGFVARDNLYLEALAAWPRIASALETQATEPE